MMRRLGDGGAVECDGRRYQLKGVRLPPPPRQRPRPPRWVGGVAPAAAKRAARLADGYIGTADMTAQARLFQEEWQRLGRAGRGRLAGGHFWLIASREPARTFAAVAPHVQYQIEVYNQWLKDAGQALFPAIDGPEDLRRLGILNVVSPAEAVDIIGAYAEATGIERYYSWTVPPGYPVERMNEHLALFAEEVMPHFRPR